MTNLKILQRVAAQLAGKIDPEQVLHEILSLSTTVLGASDGALSLIDDNDSSTLVLRFGVGIHSSRIGFRTKTSEGAIGEVWRTGSVYVVEDYRQWPLRIDDSRMSALTTSISAPLHANNSLIGVIQISWSNTVHPLTEDEISTFQQFSLLASMALESATIFNRLSNEISERKGIEEKFRNIIEASPLGIHLYKVEKDDRLVLVHANQAADHMLNLNHRILIGKTMEEAFPPLANTHIPKLYRSVAKRELSTQTFEIPYQDEHLSGTYFVTVFSIGLEEVVVLFMDITQRKQLEDELRLHRDRLEVLVDERTGDLVAANEELTAMNEEINAINAMLEDSNRMLEKEITERKKSETELRLREKQYQAASNLLMSLPSADDEQMSDVVRDALLLVKAPAGYIALYDAPTHTIDICNAVGPKEIFVMGPRSADKGMLGEVVRKGQVLFVEDYRLYDQRLPDSHLSRLTSILMIPLKKGDEVLGVLAATWLDSVHPLHDDDVAVLSQYGNLVSVVLERSATQAHMSRKNLLLQGLSETTATLMGELDLDTVLQNILTKAIELAGTPHGFVLLINEKNPHEVFFRVCHGRYADRTGQRMIWSGGVFEKVLNIGEMVVVENYATWPQRDSSAADSGVTMSMQAPLKVDGRLIGVLGFSAYGEKVPINPEKLDSLEQFAIVASIALKNALQHEQTRRLAYQDTLTGLANRVTLNEYLTTAIERSCRNKTIGALLFIDLDDLKMINDNFGHSVGDEVITAAGRHIVETVGENAFVARIGGDEFVVIIPEAHDRAVVAAIADKLVQSLSKDYEISGQYIHMSASIGVTLYPDEGQTAEDVLRNADSAMYSAKGAGRNCWRFYHFALLQEAFEKMVLTNSLRRALEREELSLHYQPKFSTETEAIIGYEALLRWNSREHGIVTPVQFIPYAEKSGLILPIGRWVLEEACRFARRLADAGYPHLRVAVNISPRQLVADDFVSLVHCCVKAAGIDTGQLEIEVTENVLIESMDDSIRKLEELRDLGIHIALDDFGTGFSSLTYLMRLPVGTLKVDKSFIDRILEDETQAQFVGFIVDMAHTLGLIVVAEGVETALQVTKLAAAGCDCIQGFVFSRPVPEDEAIKLLAKS